MKKNLYLLIMILINFQLFSQIKYFEKNWENDFGTTNNFGYSDFEYHNSTNIALLNPNYGDVELKLIDNFGDPIWTNIIASPSDSFKCIDVEIMNNGDIFTLFQTFDSLYSVLHISKFDSDGNEIWSKEEVNDLGSEGGKLKIWNNKLFLLFTKYSNEFITRCNEYNLSDSSATNSYSHSNDFGYETKAIDFIHSDNGELNLLSIKIGLTESYSELTKLDSSFNVINSVIVENNIGFNNPVSIKKQQNLLAVISQIDLGFISAQLNLYDINSYDSLYFSEINMSKSMYNDVEIYNNELYLTGEYEDSSKQKGIFIQRIDIFGNEIWNTKIQNSITNKDFESVDIIVGNTGNIFLIVKGVVNILNSYDWILYEFDQTGTEVNYLKINRGDDDDINSKIITSNDGLLILGQTAENGVYNTTIVSVKTKTTFFIVNDYLEEPSKNNGYITNKGQLRSLDTSQTIASDVNFYSSNSDYSTIIFSDKISFVQISAIDSLTRTRDVNRIDLFFEEADISTQRPMMINTVKRNFYKGFSSGITNINEHGEIYIPELYRNIDLKIHNNEAGIVMNFAVKYRGDINDIKLHLDGTINQEIIGNQLKLINPIKTIEFMQPIAYQLDVNNNYEYLICSIYYDNNNNIKFSLQDYDPSKTVYLVLKDGQNPPITPKLLGDNLLWSTYFGIEGVTVARDVATDNPENVYYTGYTTGTTVSFTELLGFNPNIPIQEDDDAFLVKFDVNIVPQWFTFYGGSNGNDPFITEPIAGDYAVSIATNKNGNKIYITGSSLSVDLPIVNTLSTGFSGDDQNTSAPGGKNEIFIARFNENGILVWSTFYGQGQDEYPFDIHLDKQENFYVVGTRSSSTSSFPRTGATNNTSGKGLILMFNSDDQLKWANPIDVEVVKSITSDESGSIYFAGTLKNNNNSILNAPSISNCQSFNGGELDGFVSAYSPNGVLTHFMYYGGNCGDVVTGLDIDKQRNIYVVGKTAYPSIGNSSCTGSTNLPVIGNGFSMPIMGSSNLNHFLFKLGSFYDPQTGLIISPTVLQSGYFGGGDSEFEGNSQYGLNFTDVSISVNKNLELVAISGATDSDYYKTGGIQMPNPQPANYYVQYYKDNNSNLNLDAYVAVFDLDFNLKYSTYFGDGKYSDAPASIVFNNWNDRLYYCGNTGTYNSGTVPLTDPDYELKKLYTEPFDDLNSTDFYQEYVSGGGSGGVEAGWFALFEMKNIYISGEEYSLSINENLYDDGIKIYPNPTKENITIVSQNNILEIKVIQLDGKLIFESKKEGNNVIINLNDFKVGTYITQIATENGTFTKKIIKL